CITPGGAMRSLPAPTTSRRPQTEPLHEPMPAHALSSIDSQLTIHEWEEELLPSLSPSPIDNQLTIHEWEEELRPSTDKLPVDSKKVVESILVALPSRPASRNLWSYSGKLPAIRSEERRVGKERQAW